MNISTLPMLLQRFFTDRLTAQLQASPNTIASYRDTFRLLLRFASERLNRPPTKLRIEDLDASLIGDPLVLSLCSNERARACASLPTNPLHAEQALRTTGCRLHRSSRDGGIALRAAPSNLDRPP